jgi:mannitol/fructose-specific phosphotransferase system IIA component (Ntr-type)
MLSPLTVRARLPASTWQEAIDQVGGLLVDAGAAGPAYIEAMKRVLREMGPYAVIAPGIALLHARPEDGVRLACLAVTTLATPVHFGHSQNDPVDIVVAMGAVDKQAHLASLRQLAKMLGDAPTLERIRSATDSHQLLSVLLTWDPAAPTRRADP